jgi:type IV secretion system protein VirB1
VVASEAFEQGRLVLSEPVVILALSALVGLAQQCAPAVAPETLLSVVRAESGFDPLVVAVNGAPREVLHPATLAEAAATATRLIAAGRSVDLGLGQINNRNLAPLGLSIADVFDPCRNLAASAQVLQAGYTRAAASSGDTQAALRTAFSFYNTGDAARGFRNGYVDRVSRAAAAVVPALKSAVPSSSGEAPAPPAWDVFARPAAALQIF